MSKKNVHIIFLGNSFRGNASRQGISPKASYFGEKAFLSGFHKAFVFSAGHCSLCDKCPEDGRCRFPEKARPSMEGSGIDVYETARNAGINFAPSSRKIQYVKYLGLLMLE